MRIERISYRDREDHWGYNDIKFFDLTLLVGISGVGKTQVLRSILSLRNIASGKALNGVSWDITFQNRGARYDWRGKFELKKEGVFTDSLGFDEDVDKEKQKPKIIEEQLLLDGIIIAKREDDVIHFDGSKMPKLSSTESLISLFKEEDSVSSAWEGFKQITIRDHTSKESMFRFRIVDLKKLKTKYKSIDEIKNSDLDTTLKLFLVSENQKSLFKEIKEAFFDVFPQIEDVKIEPRKGDDIPAMLAEIPIVHLKEGGVEKWIIQDRISSGMLRTFFHISEMYLLNEGTVILIDEFENSLGVNCINVLTEDLIFQNSSLQFIATSHHPYIINKIPYDYWKIVTRKGGEIKVNDAKDFDLGDSHHEKFVNLINLPEYSEGVSLT